MAGNRIPLGRGIVGHVAATGQVVNVPDAYEDPRFDATLDAKTGVRTRSILCVPVCVTRGKPIAVIEAVTVADPESDDHGSKRGFDETDVQALSAFSAEVRPCRVGMPHAVAAPTVLWHCTSAWAFVCCHWRWACEWCVVASRDPLLVRGSLCVCGRWRWR